MNIESSSYASELKKALSRPIVFRPSPRPTIGVEVELGVVDPNTGGLVDRGPELLEHLEAEGFAKPELFQCIVEVITGICESVEGVGDDLRRKLKRLREVGRALNVEFISSGTHPFSNWKERQITAKERYQRLVERMGQPARQMLIMGTHVHVGVDSGEKAIAIMNAISYYLPHMLAISASSPYSNASMDSNMASWRLKLFESLPTAGLSPRVNNWAEQVRLMRTLINAGAIESIREIWWDVRPHPDFGTVEVRICDAVSTPSEILMITAFIQTLIVFLGDMYDSGMEFEAHANWTLKENKWRAARYGLDRDPVTGEELCKIICDDTGTTRTISEDILMTMEQLRDTAERLGTTKYLNGIKAQLRHGASYQRQRRRFEESKDHKMVALGLVREFAEDDPGYATGFDNFWAGGMP
jgi:carboxylate-amine ligase